MPHADVGHGHPCPNAVLAYWFGDGLALGWPSASPDALKESIQSHLKSAHEHLDIIARFGHFLTAMQCWGEPAPHFSKTSSPTGQGLGSSGHRRGFQSSGG